MQASSLRLIGIVGATLLALTGCGGGDGESTANANPPSGSQNAAPTIQGQPIGSVVPGRAYSFQPTASDADGDTLTFTVANLPAWATFDASTGRISGTPSDADVATYNGISISVSDGVASPTLGPIAITVGAVGTGVATVSWSPPSQNADGSALTDLAGYEVMFGQSADDLDQVIYISNPSLTSYVVDSLTQGTWYFAVVAVNSQGVYSSTSNVASKTIT